MATPVTALFMVIIVILVITLNSSGCISGARLIRFRDVLAYRGASRSAYTGTHESSGFSTHGPANCCTGRTAGRATDDSARPALALGGDGGTYAPANRATDNGSGLAANCLAEGRTCNRAQPTANSSFHITVRSKCLTRGNHQ